MNSANFSGIADQAPDDGVTLSAPNLDRLSRLRGLKYVGSYGQILERDTSRWKYPHDSTAKPCTRCKVVKPLDAFSELKTGALGRAPRCKECIQTIGRAYTKHTRELRASRPRPEHCEACGRSPGKRALSWDHCHVSGEFRGWLCSGCNRALGHVDDNPKILRMLVRYLERQLDVQRD